MGHCPHDSSILYDGAAAHPLYDTSGQLQQSLIRHPYLQTSVHPVIFLVDLHDLNVKILRLLIDGTEHLCIALFDLLPQSNGNRFCQRHLSARLIAHTGDSLIAVVCDLSDDMLVRISDAAGHLSGISGRAFPQPDDLGIIDPSAVHLHQGAGVHIRNAMPQCSKIAVGIHIGHSTDTLGIIPDPDSQLIGAVLFLHGFYLQVHLLAVSSNGECLQLSAAFRNFVRQLTLLGNRLPIQCNNIVSGF